MGFDPHHKVSAQGFASATVIAPDLGLADATAATAALAHGAAALSWVARLPGVRAVLVTHEGTVLRSQPVERDGHNPRLGEA